MTALAWAGAAVAVVVGGGLVAVIRWASAKEILADLTGDDEGEVDQ